MAINLNMDVGQLIKGLMNKKNQAGSEKTPEKPSSLSAGYYKQAGIKSVIVLCSAAIIIWGINYLTEASGRVESEFTTLEDIEAAVVKMEQDIVSSRELLGKNRKNVEEILPMFSDIEGSKSLFKLVSNIAEQNNLVIKNLSQGEVVETTAPSKFLQTKILLEIEGFYPNYIRFKNELVKQKPILRVESESIKLNVGLTGERKINISINFIDYSVNKQEYENVLQK